MNDLDAIRDNIEEIISDVEDMGISDLAYELADIGMNNLDYQLHNLLDSRTFDIAYERIDESTLNTIQNIIDVLMYYVTNPLNKNE